MEAVEQRRVVVVLESDVLVRMLVAEHLRDCGYRVIEGVSGADFDAVLAGEIRPDCLLTDVHLLGDEDGFALATRVRQTRPEVDVILTSGPASVASKSSELCAKNGIIVKPYRTRDIETRIRSIMERRKAGQ